MRTLDNKNKKSDKTQYFYKKVADGKSLFYCYNHLNGWI